MSTAIVADRRTGLQGIDLEFQNINLFLSLCRLVNVGNICGMVLVVMEFHGRSVNVRFEGLEGVRKVGDGVGIGNGGDGDGCGQGSGLGEEGATGVGGCVCLESVCVWGVWAMWVMWVLGVVP